MVSLRKVGKDDADAGAWVRVQHLSRPLGGSADFIGPLVELHAPLGLRRRGARLVVVNAYAGRCATGEEVGLLAVHLIEAQQVQSGGANADVVRQLCMSDQAVLLQAPVKTPCPTLKKQRAGGGRLQVRVKVDAPAVGEPPSLDSQFRQMRVLDARQFPPQQHFRLSGQQLRGAGGGSRPELPAPIVVDASHLGLRPSVAAELDLPRIVGGGELPR